MTAPDSDRERAEALRELAKNFADYLELDRCAKSGFGIDDDSEARFRRWYSLTTEWLPSLDPVALRLLAQQPTPDPAEALGANSPRLNMATKTVEERQEVRENRLAARAALAQAGAVDKEG